MKSPRVAIFTERHNWIMRRCAKELATRVPNTFIVEPNAKHPVKADIYYYLPYTLLTNARISDPIRIGFFTHVEQGTDPFSESKRKRYSEALVACDFHVCMNQHTLKQLHIMSLPAICIKPGSRFNKDIVFGVCGKVHPTGRKGEDLVKELMHEFNFLAWGQGWPCKTFSQKQLHLEKFYRDKIDYLVVTSSVEGGPLPVIEALSLGVPVIAPDVGWCWEYPVIPYEKGNVAHLRSVLSGLIDVPTWESWAKTHEEFFKFTFDTGFYRVLPDNHH